jgi:hypothetical protein
MSQRRCLALALLAALAFAALAASALARKNATPAQARAVARAVKSSPVGGINTVPSNRYVVRKVEISTVSKAWAMASLRPTKAARDRFQPAVVVAVQPAGTARWVVVDLGSAEVGCGIAPDAVLADLLGLKAGESPCPPGEGLA